MTIQVPAVHPNLQEIIEAHFRAERIRGLRTFALYLLAVSGGLCWIVADLPGLIPRPWRLLLSLIWPVALVIFLVLVACELKWDLRIHELMRPCAKDRGEGVPQR